MLYRLVVLLLLVAIFAGCAYQGRVYKPKTYASPEMLEWQVENAIARTRFADSLRAVVDALAWPIRKNALKLVPEENRKADTRTQFGYSFAAQWHWDPSETDLHIKKAIRRMWGIDINDFTPQPYRVVYAIKGSPAHKAGMQAGDNILSLNGILPASREKHEMFYETNGASGVAFLIERESATGLDTLSLFIEPDHTTNYHVDIVENTEVTAVAIDNENRVVVTTGLLDFVTQNEARFVIAHEVAHLVMQHGEKTVKNANAAETTGRVAAMVGNLLGSILFKTPYRNSYSYADQNRDRRRGALAFSKEFEREADYLGMYLVAMSNQPLDGIEDLWRRLHNIRGGSYSVTHPTNAERYQNIRRYKAEIEFKKATGKELMPEKNTDEP